MLLPLTKSLNQHIVYSPEGYPPFAISIKRDDLLHPHISGNKYRKLKYNLEQASKEGKDRILTFGGAFSNHIAATAAAGNELGFRTIGIIRGDELAKNFPDSIRENPTLQFAVKMGMELHFTDRKTYRMKDQPAYIESLKKSFGDFYLVPQGGTNELAVKGTQEILDENDKEFDYICSAVGTGGTIAGIINAVHPEQKVLGFPALKGDFLYRDIGSFVHNRAVQWKLYPYHFGGFAKINDELIEFINDFKEQTNIQLDPVYTGKMLYGIVDLLKKGTLPRQARILAVHTGGLQGIDGMNVRLRKKNKNLITEKFYSS